MKAISKVVRRVFKPKPKLMICDDSGLVVLFPAGVTTKGTIVGKTEDSESPLEIGEHFENFDQSLFSPFCGEIILKSK